MRCDNCLEVVPFDAAELPPWKGRYLFIPEKGEGAYDKSGINHASGSWNATWYCVDCWVRGLYQERFDKTDGKAVDNVLRVLGVFKQNAIKQGGSLPPSHRECQTSEPTGQATRSNDKA